MPLYQAVVLAVIQSLTEFLPISSTAHLALTPWLLGWRDPGLGFDIALHLGTVSALLAYFLRDWLQLVGQAAGRQLRNPEPELAANRRLLWWLGAATLPVAATGYLFKEQAEGHWRTPWLMGSMLVLVGLLMYYADRRAKCKRDLGAVGGREALLIGLAQAVAVIPGVSRSGITITAGLLLELKRPAAARFSFLLSTPALLGAALKEGMDLWTAGGIPPELRLGFAVGVVTSALTGWLVIAFFLRYLRRHTLRFFVYYRIVLGIIVIALALRSLR